MLLGGVLRYLHGCQAGPIQFNQLRSRAFCRKFPRCHRKLMDSVTVGDLSIFQIEIGYGHKYIYIYIYTHMLHHSFSVSWLICVPVNAAGLFLPFSRPVMHLRSFRVKADQWFQSTVWSCWNGRLRNTGIARYCRVELEILRLVLGCLLTLDLALNLHLWQNITQNYRFKRTGFARISMSTWIFAHLNMLVEYIHGLQHWRQLGYPYLKQRIKIDCQCSC